MIFNNKKAQEEIIGFAIIIIIVSVILLFFLVFSISSSNKGGESYQASSFLESALVYTSSCEKGSSYLSMSELIVSCYNEGYCEIEGEREDSCIVLNEILSGLLEASWTVGSDFKTKGYKIEAISDSETIFSISKGNITNSYKEANQIIPYSGSSIRVSFRAYF